MIGGRYSVTSERNHYGKDITVTIKVTINQNQQDLGCCSVQNFKFPTSRLPMVNLVSSTHLLKARGQVVRWGRVARLCRRAAGTAAPGWLPQARSRPRRGRASAAWTIWKGGGSGIGCLMSAWRRCDWRRNVWTWTNRSLRRTTIRVRTRSVRRRNISFSMMLP